MEMGSDPRGNLIRLDNALNGIPNKIAVEQKTLEDTRAELETAKGELGKPFPQAEELAAKSVRLAELNAALNIDGRSAAEQAADTRDSAPEEAAKAKPSVMERIQELKAQIRNPETGVKRRSEQVI